MGWSEYGGQNWIWLEPNVKPKTVLLDNDLTKTIALDETSGKPWEISTYQGPTGSGIERVWEDKAKAGYAGQEIPWEFRQKEDRGIKEHNRIFNIQGNLYIRPFSEATRDTSGHDAGGFRNALEITEKIFADGALAESTRATDIPFTGNIATDRKVEAHRLQVGYSGTASELRVVRTNRKYIQRDTRGIPSEVITSEQNWGFEYALPYVWLTRSTRLALNRATSLPCTGTIFSPTTGPDGKTNSAMIFAPANGLTTTMPGNIGGDFTIQFSASSITGTVIVIAFATGNMNVQFLLAAGIYYVRLNDGAAQYTQALGYAGSGWANVQLVRSGPNLIVRENGVTLNTFALAGVTTIGGVVSIMAAQAGSLFDLRVYASAVSENAYLYYYRDLTEHSGDSVCPNW
jgi:hypothetical protein